MPCRDFSHSILLVFYQSSERFSYCLHGITLQICAVIKVNCKVAPVTGLNILAAPAPACNKFHSFDRIIVLTALILFEIQLQ